jgi:NNP family nitrate/nitrite transporter-like MFS transporter
MAVYLLTLVTEVFKLTLQDAGFRTAGFVVQGTALRPVGGVLADKIGGSTILKWVFPVTAMFAVFLACPLMSTFAIGALGMATSIGLGNGAVFRLVPEYFPKSVGGVTGLVGSAGGLGGFFPPLLLGVIKQQTGPFTFGFVLLGVFALVCLMVLLLSTRSPRLALATN